MGGWISEQAFQAACIPTVAIQDGAVTTAKILDSQITVDKLASALLVYLLPVGRVDATNVDYCKVG